MKRFVPARRRRSIWAARLRTAILWLGLSVPAAFAGDLADFNAATEQASSHNRVALGYLRTGNRDLALLELQRLRTSWAGLVQRFSGRKPDAFSDAQLYAATLTDISTRIVAADMFVQSGRLDAAGNSLLGIRGALAALRRANGIMLLSDCLLEASAVLDSLMLYDDRAMMDWTKSENRFGIAGKASIYQYELERCDRLAPDTVGSSPEFRRLIDGAKAGLALVPRAINTRDTDLLHRILIELRSFDNLLAFRYG